MKYLILLRHGEAGFSDGVDYQRPLTSAGKDSLLRLGEILRKRNMEVDFLHCSGAKRTLETAEIIKKFVPIESEEYTRMIYDGGLDSLLKILENTPNESSSCMLIGHNPTISMLLSHLTQENFLGLKPGMMAVLELGISEWKMIGLGTGSLNEILN